MIKPVWSWAHQPESSRPAAKRPGRYVRPLSIRDSLVAVAFGREVCRLRELRGLSTAELGRRVSLSQPSVTNIENGKGNIELRLVWDFADVLGVPPSHFLRVCNEAVEVTRVRLFPAKRRTAGDEA